MTHLAQGKLVAAAVDDETASNSGPADALGDGVGERGGAGGQAAAGAYEDSRRFGDLCAGFGVADVDGAGFEILEAGGRDGEDRRACLQSKHPRDVARGDGIQRVVREDGFVRELAVNIEMAPLHHSAQLRIRGHVKERRIGTRFEQRAQLCADIPAQRGVSLLVDQARRVGCHGAGDSGGGFGGLEMTRLSIDDQDAARAGVGDQGLDSAGGELGPGFERAGEIVGQSEHFHVQDVIILRVSKTSSPLLLCAVVCSIAGGSQAAPPNRIARPVDSRQTRVVPGNLHRLAAAELDRGPVEPGMKMSYMLLLTKPSTAQQADLDQLLADQQNPSSPRFHRWLTPEEFGARFGLSPSDHSKIVAWLQSEGFTIDELARARNWVAFSGTVEQVSRSLRTPIHRFEADGRMRYANTSEPSVPEALADVTGGFIGLDDFKLKPGARQAPDDNSAGSHFLVPEDYATIYNITPLHDAGLDGTGVGIAIVGESDVLLSDLQAFKKRYNLPTNNPKMVPYNGADPGYNFAQFEGTLDLEWSSAIAPKATIYYVYGQSAFSAFITAVNVDLAPIISISYSQCEIDLGVSYRPIAQQANAQGITILSSSGDSGAAGCDSQAVLPFAERGLSVQAPAVLPEVTGVGGTQFVEGDGSYWASTNSANFGSALSYIPEAAWNESDSTGLSSSGGGASRMYPRPAWQSGSGLPMDQARHVPDISLSASGHDAYQVTYGGTTNAAYGTSASAPSMAGIVALLNQYQVSKGFQAKPGLGNINPQLYRLAQSAPAVFHDVVMGDNIVPCGQGSIDCLAGSLGYKAGPGYDMATGLGSIDANALVTQWNSAAKGVTVTLASSPARITSNDAVQLTASVAPADRTVTPTGMVAFSAGSVSLGSTPLGMDGSASVTAPAYLIGTGLFSVFAEYSGDAAFTSGGAAATVRISAPTGVASLIPGFPFTVWPALPDAQGLAWQTTLSLREVAGVAAMLTGFTIDGKDQPLGQYFPAVDIPPNGSISSSFALRNLATPTTKTYGFTGIDASGQSWSVSATVSYFSLPATDEAIAITATPPVVVQDTTADPSCQWPVQIHMDDVGGTFNTIGSLLSGATNFSNQIASIFGTTHLDAYGSVSGTLCFGGITPPGAATIFYQLSNGPAAEMTVSFAGPPVNPTKISAAPGNISLAAPGGGKSEEVALAVGISDKTQTWTVSTFPANRTTSWLTVSPRSGAGPALLSVTANGAGFEPGAYSATIVLQCVNAVPQSVTVPVMFVLGGSTSGTLITKAVNAASYGNTASAGMLLSVFGSNLANSTDVPPVASPLPYSTGGVSAYVNGIAAPLIYVSSGQLNLQIPYSVGAGPAVVGINNNGEIAGFQVEITSTAPGIFDDGAGNLAPQLTAAAGAVVTLYMTGAGDVTPALKTAYWASPNTSPSNLPKPILPLSVTVGREFLAFLQRLRPAVRPARCDGGEVHRAGVARGGELSGGGDRGRTFEPAGQSGGAESGVISFFA